MGVQVETLAESHLQSVMRGARVGTLYAWAENCDDLIVIDGQKFQFIDLSELHVSYLRRTVKAFDPPQNIDSMPKMIKEVNYG